MPASNSSRFSSQTGLDGKSYFGPNIDGDDIYGLAAVWEDAAQNNELALSWCAPGQTGWTAPIHPGNVVTLYAPAIALAYDWFDVCIAWTDGGALWLMRASQFGTNINIAANSVAGAPALAYADGTLMIAYRDDSDLLQIVSYYQNGELTSTPTTLTLSNDPTLAYYEGTLYICDGGTVSDPAPMIVYAFSSSEGGNIGPVANGPSFICSAAPAVTIQDGVYCLTYSDENLFLNVIVTDDLTECKPSATEVQCHGANTSAVIQMGQLNVGWTYGVPPRDPRLHQPFIGTMSLDLPGKSLRSPGRIRRNLDAQSPCTSPSVYDPSTGQCVAPGGCLFDCVTRSFTSSGLFNPLAYAFCAFQC